MEGRKKLNQGESEKEKLVTNKTLTLIQNNRDLGQEMKKIKRKRKKNEEREKEGEI